MTISAGDVVRAAVRFSMPESAEAYNVLHFLCTSGTCDDSDLLTALDTWITALYDKVKGIIHNGVTVEDVDVVKVAWDTDHWETVALIGNILISLAGTDANDMLPHAVAAVATLPTIKPKRRGRVFVPGLTEVQQSDSLLVAGAATAMGLFAAWLRTLITSSGASLYYTVAGKGGTTNLSTGYDINGIVGSQRRRKLGVGS